VIPPFSLGDETLQRIREATWAFAKALRVVGLMNVQYAVKNGVVYVLEVNPRASRTAPYVSKAIGVPLAKIAAQVMVGKSLEDLGFTREVEVRHVAVKAPVFPFQKFPGVDILLGPEMRSTGEVMGIDAELGPALAKALLAASQNVPTKGKVFISVRDADKRAVVFLAKKLEELGFGLVSTHGTFQVLRRAGIRVERINKLHEGRPHVVDLVLNREIQLVINTPSAGKVPRTDEEVIRWKAVEYGIPCITTLSGSQAAINGIESLVRRRLEVRPLQEYLAAPEVAVPTPAPAMS
jgi:carbamoyl-phosphate synthase large subunit